MKQNLKNKIIIGILVVVVLGLGGGIGYAAKNYSNWNSKDWFTPEEIDDSNLMTNIEEKGIALKLLKTSENDDGTITKTLKYTISPSNTTNKNVKAVSKYVDDSDCSDVLTTSIDKDNNIVRLICKKAFSKKIKVEVVSENNENAKATINVDYVKKLLDVKLYNCLDDITHDTFVNKCIQGVYSDFTKDKDYTFSVSNASVSFYANGNTGNWDIYKPAIEAKIEAAITENKILSNEELWNLYDTYDYHDFLLNGDFNYCLTSTDCWGFSLEATVTSGNFSKDIQFNFSGCLNSGDQGLFDFTRFSIPIESINTEVEKIEF